MQRSGDGSSWEGWRAISALSRIFEDDVLVPCAVGRGFSF